MTEDQNRLERVKLHHFERIAFQKLLLLGQLGRFIVSGESEKFASKTKGTRGCVIGGLGAELIELLNMFKIDVDFTCTGDLCVRMAH